MTEDLKTALITWPRAPYECGSAQGWMQKAHDRIVELEETLRNAMDYMPGQMAGCDCSSCKAREIVESALQPKAGS